MILVTLLLVNMLIAMMGNTYQLVNETQKEWFRQVSNELHPLLVTFLIAMMGNTYKLLNETQKEWFRQVSNKLPPLLVTFLIAMMGNTYQLDAWVAELYRYVI